MAIGWWHDLVAAIFPEVCEVCGRPLVKGESVMCLGCRVSLPRTDYHLASATNPLVMKLASTTVKVTRATAYFKYIRSTPYTRLIHSAKYGGMERMARQLAEEYAREIGPSGFFDSIDYIVPVPLHPSRMRRRGYNQAESVARGVSAATGIPVASILEARRHSTQTRLGPFSRWINARNTFHASDSQLNLSGKHCLVVDDVVTTGATMLACCEVLARLEPSVKVSVFALATTVSL